jgi:hypothetical protein
VTLPDSSEEDSMMSPEVPMLSFSFHTQVSSLDLSFDNVMIFYTADIISSLYCS